MIARIVGEVLESDAGRLIVQIGFSNGSLGLEVLVPRSSAYDAITQGSTVSLEVYTAFREDGVELIGFKSRQEKDLFSTLLKVSGIGPKGALGILSSADPSALIRAISEGDREFLVRIPGIGKKTAERMLLELSDRMTALGSSGATYAAPSSSGRIWTEARSALSGLGYREQEIDQMLGRLQKSGEFEKPEDLVLAALKGSEL